MADADYDPEAAAGTFMPFPRARPRIRSDRHTHTQYGRTWLTRHTALKAKRAFRKFSYRGVDLDQYVPLPILATLPIVGVSYTDGGGILMVI